jgi:Rieske Fe-S protein
MKLFRPGIFQRASREPLWKEEFSVHAPDERYVSRRQFAKFLVLTSLGMFVGNLWILVKSFFQRAAVYPRQAIAVVSELTIGDVKTFSYPAPEDRCILIRTAADRFVAYSQKCTHLSCAVYYSHPEKALVCPCHKGYFSATDGSVLQGPPPRALPRIVLERSGEQLIAAGVQTSAEGAQS